MPLANQVAVSGAASYKRKIKYQPVSELHLILLGLLELCQRQLFKNLHTA